MAEKIRLLALVIAASQLVLTTVRADESSDQARAAARAHFRKGARLIQAGAYDAAVAEFGEAYRLYPNERIHYDLAQAYRLKHDDVEAAAHYRLYLAAVHDGELAADARQQLQGLGMATDDDRSNERPRSRALQASLAIQPSSPGNTRGDAPLEPTTPSATQPAEPVATQPALPTPATIPIPMPVPTPSPRLATDPVAPLVLHQRVHQPAYKKWWVWTLGGVALVGVGVGLGVGLTYHAPSPTIGKVTF